MAQLEGGLVLFFRQRLLQRDSESIPSRLVDQHLSMKPCQLYVDNMNIVGLLASLAAELVEASTFSITD